jgi:hypothetical protein
MLRRAIPLLIASVLLVGCGSNDDPVSENRYDTPPASTETQTTPTTTSTTATTTTPATTTPSTTSTTPSSSPAEHPEDTGGAAVPPSGGRPEDTGGAGVPTETIPKQDPQCKPGTGPGFPDKPQCEPVSGEDARDDQGG